MQRKTTPKKHYQKSGKAKAKLNLFIAAYCSDPLRNATAAAIKAGAPRKSAHVTASRWLKNAKVKAAVEQSIALQCKRVEIKGDWVLEQLRRIAAFDPRKLYHPNGRPKKVIELDDETATAIAGIDIGKAGRAAKYRVTDKKGVLELLGKNQRLFVDRTEQSGPNGGPIQMRVDLAQLTDDQLKAEIERKRTEIARREQALGVAPKEEETQETISGTVQTGAIEGVK